MFRFIYKSKIHRATVTEANLDYAGSITIDQRLLKAADIFSNERVQVVNVNNGTRVETYAVPGKSGSGIICMNGAAARWAHRGDKVIIISYCLLDTKNAKEYKPKVVHVDDKNRISKKL
ncbi:MAG: aspartate 1-decarboxylase [Candidatus Omnitrophica bacterium CG_4_9_14_0_2_um_filter_43_12]|nr:MAG: aspartate 1-decarboxylase [Candidatus Omnitrophica bacterium CG03_land_8_20_14_0_80_43_22]PJC46229.1 MAG: aspartate 1-decarboxylase [Candidatus Omnitrophica bacterium CG_4_9_14_0_2_um_filter_43_12]